MNPNETLKEVREYASEWIEMSEAPEELVSWILAHRIKELTLKIEYLERRLENVGISR